MIDTLEKLEYIHHTLQEVISDSNKMGDHLIDLDSENMLFMVKTSLSFVEDMREPYLEKELKNHD